MFSAGITVDRVWKKFYRGEFHDSLRDLIPALAKRLVGKGPRRDELSEGDFWALQDISFNVEPGEALGIVGPNGAGKSTLLKVLNRVIRPNRGAIQIRGRVGALIEIASGFHPDLTGRENVFLQGSVMGMSRADILRKFDEIVAFSEVEAFIDTPVKRYSTGMNARLGFSIAAHLDPEVLLIDEVLAVGDGRFQTKAFGRLKEVVNGGIPVIIVSHQLNRISTLCDRAILLRVGEVALEDDPATVIAGYVAGDSEKAGRSLSESVSIDEVTVVPNQRIRSGDTVQVKILCSISKLRQREERYNVFVGVREMQSGQLVFRTGIQQFGSTITTAGRYTVDAVLQINTPSGVYSVETGITDMKSNTLIAQGPPAVVEVKAGAPFAGSIQMNAQLNVASTPPSDRTLGAEATGCIEVVTCGNADSEVKE